MKIPCCGYWDETPVPPGMSPERALMVGVLCRSFWDLNYLPIAERFVIASAIRWFTTKSNDRYIYTFSIIKDVIDLNHAELNIIQRVISEAELYLRSFSKVPPHHVRQKFARINKHYFQELPRVGQKRDVGW